MKSSLLFALIILGCPLTRLSAQSSYVRFLDGAGKFISDEKKAVTLSVESQEKDKSWRMDSYNAFGPLIKTEHFKTRTRSIPHGSFLFYNASGRVDSIQRYTNGIPNGEWHYFNDTGKVVFQKTFVNGKLEKIADYLNPDTLAREALIAKDSLRPGEKESEFKGGSKGWRTFLSKNFTYPNRAFSHDVKGQVVVGFEVDSVGNISDPIILKSVEYSLDFETLRIMNISPAWEPGEVDGKKVSTFKRQPITFTF